MGNGIPFRLTEKAAHLRELARQLMLMHGLTEWEFGLNTNVRRAGVCFYPHGSTPGRIELSAHFAERNPDEEIRDTILHEIAHALVGPKHGHDEVWQAMCLKIGARPIRCYGQDVAMPKGPWRAKCPSCEMEYDRHRKPPRQMGWYCRSCGLSQGRLVWSKIG